MDGGELPDGGAWHPEAADGRAFNGAIGLGLSEVLLGLVDAERHHVKTICDFGCGNGYLAGQLGRRGFTVLGIDASDTYLEIARARNATGDVSFMKGAIDRDLAGRLRSSRPPFDLVITSDVIEHLFDPLEFLQAAHALLRPGGVVIVGTPYHGYLKNLAISLTGQWDAHHGVHWLGGHIKFFSVPALSQMLLGAGFDQPRFSFYGRIPGFWKNMIAVASRPS